MVAEQRLRVVRAALFVAHGHWRRRRLAAVGDERRVTGWHEVFDPPEAEVGDAGVEPGDVVGGAEDHVGVEADPPRRRRGPGGAQAVDRSVEVRCDRDLESPPAGGPELVDLGGDGLRPERRRVADDRRGRQADRSGAPRAAAIVTSSILQARSQAAMSTTERLRMPIPDGVDRMVRVQGVEEGGRADRAPKNRRSAGRSSWPRSRGPDRRVSGSRRSPTCRRRRRCARGRTRGGASPTARRRWAPPTRRESRAERTRLIVGVPFIA